jgi:LysM repeat protein
MPIKNITLGICLLAAGNALARDVHYKVEKGDSFKSIAVKFHVDVHRMLVINELDADHHLRPGHYLTIPGVPDGLEHGAASYVPARAVEYTIRNGDCDWTLARRYGIGVGRIHDMNPGVNWESLKLGLMVKVPGQAQVHEAKRSAPKLAKLAAVKTHHGHGDSQVHTVAVGENDWIIAHHFGVRLPLLKELNPSLNLEALKPGQRINVPAHHINTIVAIKAIRTSHVAINGDSVVIRREGGLHADKITMVDGGTKADLLVRDGNWYQLRFPKGTVGWVRGDHLKPIREERIVSLEQHREQRRSRIIIPEHVSHHEVAVVHHHRSHGKGSVEHYSTTTYADMDTDSDTASEVLRKAESFRGVRYRWGMSSRSGTDCSGFTQQVFGAQGIHLPRTSSDQSQVGERVTYRDLKPGDLLFFHTYGGRRVTHVAIYKGNGNFLHASSRGGHVQEDSLSEDYYQHHLVGIRRVLHSKHHSSSKKSAPSTDSSYPTNEFDSK